MGKTKKQVIVTFRCPVCGDSYDYLYNDDHNVRSKVAKKALDIMFCAKCIKKGSQINYRFAELHST